MHLSRPPTSVLVRATPSLCPKGPLNDESPALAGPSGAGVTGREQGNLDAYWWIPMTVVPGECR